MKIPGLHLWQISHTFASERLLVVTKYKRATAAERKARTFLKRTYRPDFEFRITNINYEGVIDA